MVPEGVVGLVGFLFFIAPGTLFEALLTTRRPRAADTTFREITRVVLVSVLAGAGAVVLALIPRVVWPLWLQPLVMAVERGGDVWRQHLFEVGAGVALVFAVAMGLAAAAAGMVIRRSPGGRMVREPQWYLVFRRRAPEGTVPYVITTSPAGERHFGWLVAYSQDEEVPNREITLGPRGSNPLLRAAPGQKPKPLLDVAHVVVSNDQIAHLYVAYIDPTDRRTVAATSGREQEP